MILYINLFSVHFITQYRYFIQTTFKWKVCTNLFHKYSAYNCIPNRNLSDFPTKGVKTEIQNQDVGT